MGAGNVDPSVLVLNPPGMTSGSYVVVYGNVWLWNMFCGMVDVLYLAGKIDVDGGLWSIFPCLQEEAEAKEWLSLDTVQHTRRIVP